jgi:hypothetical protein
MFHDLVPKSADLDNVGLVRWEVPYPAMGFGLKEGDEVAVLAAFVRDGDTTVAVPVAFLLDNTTLAKMEASGLLKGFHNVKVPDGVIPAYPYGDGEVVQVEDVHYVDGKEVRRG